MSEHFTEEELSCKCCRVSKCDPKLYDLLELIRKILGNKPLHVNSAYRCLEHNTKIGSKDTSQHVKGTAADIKVTGEEQEILIDMWNDGFIQGLGLYNTFTHVDIRDSEQAFWDRRENGDV